jgi:hypothetical protein
MEFAKNKLRMVLLMTPKTVSMRGIFSSFATMRTLTNLFIGSVVLLFAVTATAASLVWTFDNALFQDDGGLVGGTASGSFTFDTVTETYSDIDISTSTSTGLLNQYGAVFSGCCKPYSTFCCVIRFARGANFRVPMEYPII